jgi:hypothetical protein
MLASIQNALMLAVLIDEHPPKPESRWSALPIAESDEAALPREHLYRKLAAIFPGHHLLDGRDDRRTHRAVILDLLGTDNEERCLRFCKAMHNARFIRVLKTTPAAYVINEDRFEISVPALDVR